MRTIKGAACWASYLINGDPSGLEDNEIAACDAWLARELEGSEHIVDCSNEPYFSWSFDLHTGMPYRGGELLKVGCFMPRLP